MRQLADCEDELGRAKEQYAALEQERKEATMTLNRIAEAMNAYPDSNLVSLAETLTANAAELERLSDALARGETIEMANGIRYVRDP
jgi:chromosome segregation ATPase